MDDTQTRPKGMHKTRDDDGGISGMHEVKRAFCHSEEFERGMRRRIVLGVALSIDRLDKLSKRICSPIV